nr:hypothetical protein [Mycobacterium uberis]
MSVDVLTTIIDGELMLSTHPDATAVRAAVTNAPDDTQWVGLSTLCGADDPNVTGHVGRLCRELLARSARRDTTRGYLCVDEDTTATAIGALSKPLGCRAPPSQSLLHRTVIQS